MLASPVTQWVSQYLSIKYTERLGEAGIEPSAGSAGDSCDNALWRQSQTLLAASITRGQLVEREALLQAVQAGDTLVIAAPFCIGLSEKDAAWFLGELSARGVAVIVNGDLVRRVASAQNVHHVRQVKRRAAKSK
ncbi:hypothetical protein [Leisingera aquimarina]|uniref:hypothetical protein n=1 Tax=Leisingera aquimarina TaxID=476529 RepID=UPI0003F6AA46